MADLPERDDLGFIVYNESMSLQCQRGVCDDCPERDQDQIDGCSCVCHIPDNTRAVCPWCTRATGLCMHDRPTDGEEARRFAEWQARTEAVE